MYVASAAPRATDDLGVVAVPEDLRRRENMVGVIYFLFFCFFTRTTQTREEEKACRHPLTDNPATRRSGEAWLE